MTEPTHPRWSVLIPAYAPGANLEIAVQSVLAAMEGRHDYELVIVDDASPIPIAVAELGERGRVERLATNVGAVANFNRSLDLARGEFVHILHADDYVEPGFYRMLEKGLALDGVVAAACRVTRVDGDGAIIETMKPERSTAGVWNQAVERLAVSNRVPAPSIVAKRSTYDRVGRFDESLSHAADWDMWIRIALAGDFYYDPAPMAAYRVHSGQHTARVAQTGANIDEAVQVIGRHAGRLGDDAKPLMAKALLYRAVFAARTALGAATSGDFTTAAAQLRAAAKCTGLAAKTAVLGM